MDFSHLSKLNVTEDSAVEFPITEIDGTPILLLHPANESNKAYMNAMLRLSGATKGTRRANKQELQKNITSNMRNYDRQAYPGSVVYGWRNVVDASGEEVEFTVEAATSFLAALPDWIFDRVRVSAAAPETFLDQAEIDVEEKAGN